MIITSTNPYYDDYDDNNKFHKILFRPGYAVQARELTQSQTIIQSQIERFGKHIFDEGSLVTGGQFDIDNNVPYVVLHPFIPGTSAVDIDLLSFESRVIQGETSEVKAYVIKTGYFVLDPETDKEVPTLFIRYMSGGQNGQYSQFVLGETLKTIYNVDNKNPIIASISTEYDSKLVFGKGSLFTIQEGTVFTHGFFANFTKQTVITSAFSQKPTCRVGFFIDKLIVSSDEDESLLDNAQGYPNYAAPGADRLKLDPILSVISVNNISSLPEFVELFLIREGVVQQTYQRSQYAVIGDEIAKRTYDESGDYVIRGMGVIIREHIDTGENEGYLSLDDGGDANLLAVGIEPGLAYVKGYEINNLVTSYVSTPKSVDTVDVTSQVVTPRVGNYIHIKEAIGTLVLDKGTLITLYDQPQERLSNRSNSLDAAPVGNIIGTARVRSVTKQSGVLGTSSAILRLYLFDIRLNPQKSFADAKAIFGESPTFFGDIVLNDKNIAVLNDTINVCPIYPVGTYIHRIRSHDKDTGDYDVNMTYVRQHTKQNIYIDSNGVANVTELGNFESFNYGFTQTDISSSEKDTIILSLNQTTYVFVQGSVSGVEGQNILTGTDTKFTLLNPGDKIQIFSENDYSQPAYPNTLTVLSVDDNFKLTVNENLTVSIPSGSIIRKMYYKGDIIDLNTKGSSFVNNNGSGRQVTVGIESKVLFINLYENFINELGELTPVYADISYLVDRNNAKEAIKNLVPNVHVKIKCKDYYGNLQDSLNLGFSDVYKLHEIRKAVGLPYPEPLGPPTLDPFLTGTEGDDVTSLFTFDDGQRDDVYDYATITPTASLTLTDDDWLLIKLDVFTPILTEGQGYFSIDSYPVDDTQQSDASIFTHEIPLYKSKTSGHVFDLRNCLDFRPIKLNASIASNHTSVENAFVINTDPLNVSSFVEAGGLKLPDPTENIETDFSYYLARRDVVTVDKNGFFNVIKGVSSLNPVTPVVPESVMGIAKIFIPPYPSLSMSYARLLGKESISCKLDMITFFRHTMRDIGILKERVTNLEYYNSINMLEKKATDMLILDEDGYDRFKNGFFVDGFIDHSLGATYNSDYKIVIDNKETVIRPMYNMESLSYDTIRTLDNNLVKINNEGVILKYTETTLLEQLKATSYRNIEQSIFRFIGTLNLTPDTDSWIDVDTVDQTINMDFSYDYPASVLESTWGAWQTLVTGYNLYDRKINDRSGDPKKATKFYGTFTTYSEALSYAKQHDPDGRFLIETVTTEERERTNLIQSDLTDTQNFGSFVTDVSLATYIRPIIIVLHATGLKPYTRFHVFFDGENMNKYVSYVTVGQTTVNVNGSVYSDTDFYKHVLTGKPPYTDVPIHTEGLPVYSNQYGEILALLRLPSEGKRFRVGTKAVKITDSPTNSVDATSFCENYFVGQGLITKKQNTIISLKQTIVLPSVEREERTTKYVPEVFGPSCMAYSFKVNAPDNEEGVFLTSVDVWIKDVDVVNKLGLDFEIREMNSAGGITRNQVPYSAVYFRWNPATNWFDDRKGNQIVLYNPDDNIGVSDLDRKTTVKFDFPVFLMNNTQYAFVIHTEGLNPNTYFWVSRLGEMDVVTKSQVNARQLTGNVYTTNNNLNWDIVPDLDLKVRFNRAKFTPNSSGVLNLGNKSYDFLMVDNLSGFFSIIGESIQQSQVINLTISPETSPIVVGDVIKTSTEQVGATVVKIVNNDYFTTGFNFVANQSFSVINKNTTGTINYINTELTAYGVLTKHDLKRNTLNLSQSNGLFVAGCMIKGVTSGNTALISSINNKNYSTLTFNPDYLEFKNTSCSFKTKGVYSDSIVGDFYNFSNDIKVIPNSDINFNKTCMMVSCSNEKNYKNNEPSLQSSITLTTQSEFVSPIVSLTRLNSVVVTTLINDDVTGENNPKGGNLLNKYISKTVTLAEGQDAEDLLVALTAYVPPGTSNTFPIKVWMKIWNHEDTGSLFENKNWIELVERDGLSYSSLSNTNDFRSFTFKIPSNMMLGPVGQVQYSNQGNMWIPNTTVEAGTIVYVIDDLFQNPGGLRYRHYKVLASGTTGDTPPAHLSGSAQAINGTAILRAQYESFGELWTSNKEVTLNQILYVANANNDGFRHYKVTTAGNLQSSSPPSEIFPDTTVVYGNGVKIESYLPINGNLYNGFKQFAVKIGLLGTNPNIVPRVGDLRVIALQM